MQDEAEKKQIRNLCARLLKVGFPQQTTEAPNHNPHTIPLQHYATVSLQHFKGCTVYLITLTNILHLQRRISCSYSNWGLEWIFHTVRVAFHKETVTSPCSLTGYHHSNVPCTSECISMRYYYASRGYKGGNPLSYHSVACGSWSSRGVAWQIQRYTCTRRSMIHTHLEVCLCQ